MSKNLPEVQQPQVYSFLQHQLESSRQTNDTLQLMLNRMMQVEVNVNEKFTEMTTMVDEVRNDMKLSDAQCYELQTYVYNKSKSLSKDRFQEEDADFKTTVGKYRRMIWSKLKMKFEVSRYNHIRKIDFDQALEFADTFRPEDYI